MKKFLTTAMVLGALYGTANAAPITSPIYMPEAGKILSNINLGYTSTIADDKDFKDIYNTDEIYKAMSIDVDGLIGVNEKIAINYGFNFDFAKKVKEEDDSALFNDYYFGATFRAFEADVNKFDIILNFGQSLNLPSMNEYSRPYAELGVRYGLELSNYNLGLSVKGRYVPELEIAGNKEADAGKDFMFALENEFILNDQFTIGLDLTYSIFDEDILDDSYNVFGFNIDANYAVAENNYVGVYFGMDSYKDIDHVDPITYNCGVKYVTQF